MSLLKIILERNLFLPENFKAKVKGSVFIIIFLNFSNFPLELDLSLRKNYFGK